MTIQSVNRAIDILYQFSNGNSRLGITEISKALGLSKPTVHGLVRTLTNRGILAQDPFTRKYALGIKLYELGTFLLGTLKVNQLGAEPAHRLAESTNQMIRISIWDESTILVTLNLVPGAKAIQFQQLGPRVPAYCSASGKVILASLPPRETNLYLKKTTLSPYTANTITDKKLLIKELEEAREQGFARDREEYMLGIACVSSAIFDHTGVPTAAVSVSAVPQLLFGDKFSETIKEMKKTAMEISLAMGYIQ